MSGTVTTPPPVTTPDTSDTTGGIDGAIASMKAAFQEAIETNAKITVLKTRLGAEETAAQQRPNIG